MRKKEKEKKIARNAQNYTAQYFKKTPKIENYVSQKSCTKLKIY
jgi:hypothetical protein